ncbi:MAG: hypothetical protein OXU61_05225, partial [Gammaproteobacteria bacterium]|nr:hypothetical protein [Gammaproteobacteria bacterium]
LPLACLYCINGGRNLPSRAGWESFRFDCVTAGRRPARPAGDAPGMPTAGNLRYYPVQGV